MSKSQASNDENQKKQSPWTNVVQENSLNPQENSSDSEQSIDDPITCGIPLNSEQTLNLAQSSNNNSLNQSQISSLTTSVDNRLDEISQLYEIPSNFLERLRLLEHFKMIIVCDDSSSMKTFVDHANRTRWDELKEFVQIIFQIGTIFDSNGLDIYFLNRQPLLNVQDSQRIQETFSNPPHGVTPLVDTLRYIFKCGIRRDGNEKEKEKTLIFIATDGAPTDRRGNINVEQLKKLLNEERQVEKIYISFLICTDDPPCVDYLNDWDRTMINVDVTDDFRTEREQIWKTKGNYFPFSKGEYIVKALIGAIDPDVGTWDQPKDYSS